MGAKSSRPVHSADDVFIRSAQVIDQIVHFITRLFGRFFVDLFAPAPPSRLCDEKGVCLVPATRLQASKDRKRKAEERMRRAAAAAAGLDPRVELSRQNTRDSTATGLSRRNTRTYTQTATTSTAAPTPRLSPRLAVVGLPSSPTVDVPAFMEKLELKAQQQARKEKRRSSTAQPVADAMAKAGEVRAAAGEMLENAKHKAEGAKARAGQLVDKANAVEAEIRVKAGHANERARQLYDDVREQANKLEKSAGEALARARQPVPISGDQEAEVSAMLGELAKAPAPRPEAERKTNKEREKVSKEKKLWVMGNVAPSGAAPATVPAILEPASIRAVLAEPALEKSSQPMPAPAARAERERTPSNPLVGPVPGRMAALLAPPAAVVRKSSKKGRGERDDGLMGEKAGTPATQTLKVAPASATKMDPLVVSRRDRNRSNAGAGHSRSASLSDIPEGKHSRRSSAYENVTFEVVASSDVTMALQAAAERQEAEDKVLRQQQRRKRMTAPAAPSAAAAQQVSGESQPKATSAISEEKYVMVDAPLVTPVALVAPIAARGPVLVAPRPTRPSAVVRNAATSTKPPLQIDPVAAPPRSSTVTPPPRSSTASPSVLTPFFSKALASLEAVRSWSPSNANGVVGASSTDRTSTPPTPVSAGSPAPVVVSPKEMANAACKSRKESTARERRMWRDEVNRMALHRMHETRTRSPAMGASAGTTNAWPNTVGSAAGTGIVRHVQNPAARMGAANAAVLNAGKPAGGAGAGDALRRTQTVGSDSPAATAALVSAPHARRPNTPSNRPKTLSAGSPGLVQQPVARRAARA